MKTAPQENRRRTAWTKENDCSIDDFRFFAEQDTILSDFPLASEVVSNVLVYDAQAVSSPGHEDQDALASEWVYALSDGPGVICIRGAYASQLKVLDAVTDAFLAIMQEEEANGVAKGDHFVKAGGNSRIWNASEKLAVRSPDAFVAYYSNPVVAMAAWSWLGRGYQITSQVNVVRSGGEARALRRDYHSVFVTNAVAERYPEHVHTRVSPLMTLQGVVAHCDLPLESGPMILMPHSQKYNLGYLAWRRQEFRDYFEKHGVQVPLRKGDVIFFNPALFHAGGSNVTTDVQPMANSLQISSALGRTMETIDRERMLIAIYPVLLDMAGRLGSAEVVSNAIAASADGYPFPTNLGVDAGEGLAPESQAEMVHRAVAERWEPERFQQKLRKTSDALRSRL